PDVRRMLMTMRAYREALRGLLYLTARYLDEERHADTPEERTQASEMVALLTPITKAWSTDVGVEMASLGIQVHGGVGYVEETGAAQHYRDVRIAPIYEGTNGIQAIDLVMRKLTMGGGEVVERLITQIEETVAEMRQSSTLDDFAMCLDDGVDAVTEAVEVLLSRLQSSPNDALAGATPFLRLIGTVIGGWLLGKAALAAEQLLAAGSGDSSFLSAKIATARFYGEQILPSSLGLVDSVKATSELLFTIPDAELAR